MQVEEGARNFQPQSRLWRETSCRATRRNRKSFTARHHLVFTRAKRLRRDRQVFRATLSPTLSKTETHFLLRRLRSTDDRALTT